MKRHGRSVRERRRTHACLAGNSLLCRAALGDGHVDPSTFTVVRLGSGALVLLLLVRGSRAEGFRPPGPWASRSLALVVYAALFSWAYVRIGASVGALVLFACVQLTMLGWATVLVTQRGSPEGIATGPFSGGVLLLGDVVSRRLVIACGTILVRVPLALRTGAKPGET